MELLYLWIEDFRNIKKQGFDFSAEFKFQITQTVDEDAIFPLLYKLNITYNDQFVDLFDSNIINVTGIIGKNGSGKSTLLHCIKILTGKLSTLLSPLIFCIRDSENKIHTYYYNGGGSEDMKSLNVLIEIDNIAKSKYKFEKPKPYSINRFGIDGSNVLGLDFDFKEISCCFFSNIFDSHRESIYEGIHNISTNYKLDYFLNDYIKNREKDSKKSKSLIPKMELWPSHLFQYHKYEFKGLLKFLSYAKTRKSGHMTNLPKSLNITFLFDDYEYLVAKDRNYYYFEAADIEAINKLAFSLINQSKDKRKNFLNIIVLTSFYYVLRNGILNPEIMSLDLKRNQIKDIVNKPNDLFENIRKIMAPLSKVKDESIGSKAITEFLGKSFEKGISKIEFSDTENISDNNIHYRLKIENNLWAVLNIIFDLQALDNSSFMEYSWGSGLSSGQEAFINHFARLFELKNKIKNTPIWLLIDEGDLYFHPEWQRKYFAELLEYVKFLFPRNNVQIIITSHSPFLASDLPRQNLIFLTTDIDDNCKVSNNEIQHETFGANIHELYSKSFFLNGALIGDFAKSKIDKLFQILISKKNLENKELVNSMIQIIGEPIIKTKLIEMYAEKVGENVELARLKAQQKYINERLKELDNNDSN